MRFPSWNLLRIADDVGVTAAHKYLTHTCTTDRYSGQCVDGRHADGLLEEGLLGMVEAERLVDDVRLRLDSHRQDGDRLAVVSPEVAVNNSRL